MRRRFMNSHKTFDYSKYMTIEVLEDGYEVYFRRDVEYNLNGHKWVSLKANLISPTLKKGDLLSLRCSLMPGEGFGRFVSNGKAINLRGNVLSLIFKDDINLDISGYSSVFYDIFNYYYGNNIVCVEKNFLPATTLARNCYNGMFSGCTNLTTAPALPATTLARNCYNGMFEGCTSLTVAPELPATTLADGCYQSMFNGCTKLNYIKMLATDISASYCLDNWVEGVASTGTFVKNKDATWNVTGAHGIPEGWTVVNDGEESGSNLITFTYAGIEYYAEEGMTWWQFINSTYNDGTFIAESSTSGVFERVTSGFIPIGYNYYTKLYANAVIEDKHVYTAFSGGGSDD